MINKLNKRLLFALTLNVVIVILECIGFYLRINTSNKFFFKYYTELSNVISLFSSLFFMIFAIKSIIINSISIPKWVKRLKYICTSSLALTFFIVFLTILPITNKDFSRVMLSDSFVFHHTLCPIVSIISFVFLEDYGSNTKKDLLIACLFTYIYAFTVIILNAFKFIRGPYSFLHVYEQPLYLTIAYILIILVGIYLISKLLLICNNYISNKCKSN